MLKKEKTKILDLHPDPDSHQNVMGSTLGHVPSFN